MHSSSFFLVLSAIGLPNYSIPGSLLDNVSNSSLALSNNHPEVSV